MKNKPKKPTMKELNRDITEIIHEVSAMGDFLRRLDSTVGAYIEYNKDADSFKKWITKQMEEKLNEPNREDLRKSSEGNRETQKSSVESSDSKGKTRSKAKMKSK